MNREQWLEQAELYALGVLDQEARVLFEQHLLQTEAFEEGRNLLKRISEVRETLTLFDKALPLQMPSAAAGEKLFAQIDREVKEAAAHSEPALAGLAQMFSVHRLCVSAAIFFAAALGWSVVSHRQEAAQFNQIIVSLQESLQQSRPVMELMADERTRVVELKGLGPSPQAAAYVFWNPATRQGIFSGRNLSSLTRVQVYQLWALAGQQPVPAGFFRMDAGGAASFVLPKLPQDLTYDTFAVTTEPAGGSDKPTGEMHLAGKVFPAAGV